MHFKNYIYLPVFDGYSKFLMWRSTDPTSSIYTLMSESHISTKVPNCKGLGVPYDPGFVYVALESSQAPSLMLFESKPDFLSHLTETMDASNRKVCECEFSFDGIKTDELKSLSNGAECEIKEDKMMGTVEQEDILQTVGEKCRESNSQEDAHRRLKESTIEAKKEENKEKESQTFRNVKAKEILLSGEKVVLENKNDKDKKEAKEDINMEDIVQAGNLIEKNQDNLEGMKEGKETRRCLIPGQPEERKIPSTSLTERSFTKVYKRRISSLRYPCFTTSSEVKQASKKMSYQTINKETCNNSEVQTSDDLKGNKNSLTKIEKEACRIENVKDFEDETITRGSNIKTSERMLTQNKQFQDWVRSEGLNQGYPKDKNLIPEQDETQMVTVRIKHKHSFQFKMEKSSTFKEMKKSFCRENKLKMSSVRFLFEGKRILDCESPDSVGIVSEDEIEVFSELRGGGKPEKKNISGDSETILGLLEGLSEHSEDSDNCSLVDENEIIAIPNSQVRITELRVNFVGNVGLDSKIEDKEISDNVLESIFEETELLKEISPEFDNHEATSKESTIEVVHHFPEQESFQWQDENDPMRKEYLTTYKKQLKKCVAAKCQENKNTTLSEYEETEKMCMIQVENEEVESTNESHADKIQDRVLESPKVSLLKATPQKRIELFNRFGIKTPSPLTKIAKVTEKEIKQLSIAVHLWAENQTGGKKQLEQVRLTKKHFKEIIDFAGPGTRYNLIKGRSPLQYQIIWRNEEKSKNLFQDDCGKSFVNDMGFHNSSKQQCPFEHCMTGILSPMKPLEMDLVFATRSPRVREIAGRSRQLFRNNDKKAINTLTVLPEENENTAQPSPTKEELNCRKRKLLTEIQEVSKKLAKYDNKVTAAREEKAKTIKPALLRCTVEACDKTFNTRFGLTNHQRKHHPDEDIIATLEKCEVCGKDVMYIDRHLRTVHKEVLLDEVCEVCQKVSNNMKKHRGECNKCPLCGKKEPKKIRLLKHIRVCKELKNAEINSPQIAPLDLSFSSPMKQPDQRSDISFSLQKDQKSPLNLMTSEIKQVSRNNLENLTLPQTTDVVNLHDPALKSPKPRTDTAEVYIQDNSKKSKKQPINAMKDNNELTCENREIMKERVNQIETLEVCEKAKLPVLLDPTNNKELLNQKRTQYPFEEENGEEYESEYEENDDEDFTKQRRENKDRLEFCLREIDCIPNVRKEGDDEIVNQFRRFMKVTTLGENNVKSGDVIEPSTIGLYTLIVQNDILNAFHDLFKPFDARWLLDCTTSKECKFEGEERSFVNPSEPIYLTARVLRKAIERYKTVENGQQRAQVLGSAVQFMHFIELNFNDKLNLYGREPLEKVICYHNGVKSFINSTKIWKTCNKDKRKGSKNNKVLKEYEHPNFEAEILKNYQEYLKSPARRSQIRKLLDFSAEGSEKPSDKEMSGFGQYVMGEVVGSIGCRPCAVYRMPVGAYVGKKPGFNPQKMAKDDSVVNEDDTNNFKRLNPNLPPKHLACTHQLQQKVAICPENCENRCDPSGFNIYCDWDKTRDSNGSSYLHFAKPIKDILDLYDIIKSNFFEGRRSKYDDDDWLHDENTPFFLNSSGSPFKTVDMKHVSEELGIDITAYSLRDIVSTWAISHECEEIRRAEGEALQHSFRVAQEFYQQNKMLKPQTLTQRYIEEEGILPDELREEIKRTEIKTKQKISETEEKRQKKQHIALLERSEAHKKLQRETRPLGPRNRIQGVDRNRFKTVFEELTGENIDKTVKLRSPLKFRHFIVRTVCAAGGVMGEELRNIWRSIYKGDEKWGVRDVRFKAKANNWPKKDSNACFQRKDRNSWIASSILKSLQAESRINEKRGYIDAMNE